MSKVVVIGDPFVSSNNLAQAAKELKLPKPIEIKRFDWYPDETKESFRKIIKVIEHEGPNQFDLPEGLLEEMVDSDYLLVHIAPVSKKMLQAANKLKLIGTCRGGLEHIDIQELRNKPETKLIHVIRNAEPVADFTIGLMYAVVRNIASSYGQVKEAKWPQKFNNDPYKTSFSNLTVGLIGLGNIGKIMVKRLTGLGMKVIAYDAFANQKDLKTDGYEVELKNLDEVFSEADVVSLHLRVVEATINLINKDLLALMKSNAYLINTARPDILNKSDFIECLKNRHIAGAGIDVIWEEPIKPNDPLLELDNLIITSHIAGDTVDAIDRSPQLLLAEVNKYLEFGKSDMLIK